MAGLRLTLDVPAADEQGRAVRKVVIEADEVELVYQSTTLRTTVRFRSGCEIEVREDFDTVVTTLWGRVEG